MNRRTFVGTAVGLAGFGTLGTGSAVQNGNGRGNSNGNGRGNGDGGLVNAEETGSGAIVATDDGFVISDQEITVDNGVGYDGGEGAYIIYNDGYDGEISNNEISVDEVPESPTFGIRVEGGDVDVRSNTVDGDDALGKQFLSIGVADGATGRAEDNTLNGGHRVGILAEGSGTDISIRSNDVTGLGPKSDGWAENGIQISGDATGDVRDNTVEDHWWDLDNFQSSGIILYQPGDSINIQRNEVRNNDAGIALWGGDRHNAIHNAVEVSEADPGENGVAHYGVLVLDTENTGVRQNTISATDGDIGILVYSSAENTKLIGNDVSGFDELIVDQGADTKLPNPFDPNS
ncbi:right-handed parallel beta-helix repeat-containing protein [Natronoarchaeum mannanilyticum]|uniref:Right handed beta helix domain-containing protein n=1 Tax=Natronoarchaeum mannanilyticum TaxID=926360 RepID=A0AAV3TCJ0_9EURY